MSCLYFFCVIQDGQFRFPWYRTQDAFVLFSMRKLHLSIKYTRYLDKGIRYLLNNHKYQCFNSSPILIVTIKRQTSATKPFFSIPARGQCILLIFHAGIWHPHWSPVGSTQSVTHWSTNHSLCCFTWCSDGSRCFLAWLSDEPSYKQKEDSTWCVKRNGFNTAGHSQFDSKIRLHRYCLQGISHSL